MDCKGPLGIYGEGKVLYVHCGGGHTVYTFVKTYQHIHFKWLWVIIQKLHLKNIKYYIDLGKHYKET